MHVIWLLELPFVGRKLDCMSSVKLVQIRTVRATGKSNDYCFKVLHVELAEAQRRHGVALGFGTLLYPFPPPMKLCHIYIYIYIPPALCVDVSYLKFFLAVAALKLHVFTYILKSLYKT